MNFSKLGSNEKLAVYGSVAVIVGLIVASAGFGFGLGTLALLAAIVMLVIVFLPQMSPSTALPGSKGSLMLIAGAVACASLVLTLLSFLSFFGALFGSLNGILFLVAVIGSAVMAWAGWNEFQAEGGKFQLGSASTGAAGTPPPTTPSEPVAPPPPAPTPSEPPAGTAPPPAAPVDRDDEDRPPV